MEKRANAASVALIRGDEVLLIQRAFAPFEGLWTLPGGRCEPGEEAGDAAVREVFEELGLAISDLHPVTELVVGGTWLLAVFATQLFHGEIVASDEVSAWRWTDPAGALSLETTPELHHVLALALRDPTVVP